MILLILFFGLILRLISINQSLWLDEATSALVAQMSLKDIFIKFLPGDFHPPLYYLLLHYWSVIFGTGEISIRIPSVIFGVLTIYSVYLIGKEFLSERAGIISALLLATSGLHVYYSQEARMYSLATLLVSLTVLFFVKTIKKSREGDFVMFGLFLALSILTDYLPVLIIPVFWLFGLVKKKNLIWWGKFVMSHIILLSLGLMWLPYFSRQINKGLLVKSLSPSWWQILGTPNFKQIVLIPIKFIFGRVDLNTSPQILIMVLIALLVFGIILFPTIKKFKEVKILWIWLVVPLILGIILSFLIPALSYFRFLFVLPAFCLLVGFGISQLTKNIQKWVIILLVIFNLVTSAIYLFNSKNYREDWRGLTNFIESEKEQNSITIFVAESNMEAYRYYVPNAKIAGPSAVTKGYDQIWLMRYVKDIFDPEDKVRARFEELGYKKMNEYDFNGIVVWKYEK